VSAATDTFVLAVDPFDPDVIKESAADTIFHIRGKRDDIGGFTNAELVVRKQCCGPSGMTFPFDAREVPMGNDSYGEPLASRIIDWNVRRRGANG
jgi:hypothetical protein